MTMPTQAQLLMAKILSDFDNNFCWSCDWFVINIQSYKTCPHCHTPCTCDDWGDNWGCPIH